MTSFTTATSTNQKQSLLLHSTLLLTVSLVLTKSSDFNKILGIGGALLAYSFSNLKVKIQGLKHFEL